MSSSSGSSWEQFVQDTLLYANILDRISLITNYGEQVYCWGPEMDENECQQFKGIFNSTSENQDIAICQKGFSLRNADNEKIHYKVYKKSLCSMYCTSENGRSGLIVCNLPYGKLLATYPQSAKAQDAVDLVETACTLLRN